MDVLKSTDTEPSLDPVTQQFEIEMRAGHLSAVVTVSTFALKERALADREAAQTKGDDNPGDGELMFRYRPLIEAHAVRLAGNGEFVVDGRGIIRIRVTNGALGGKLMTARDFLDLLVKAVLAPQGCAIRITERAPDKIHRENWGTTADAMTGDALARYESARKELERQHPLIDWDGVTESRGEWRSIALWFSETQK